MEDDFTEKLAQEVRKIKENKEWQVEYMTLLMREREKYNEGIAEGVIQGAVQACKNFNLSFQETVQYLIDNLNLTLQEAEDNVNLHWR